MTNPEDTPSPTISPLVYEFRDYLERAITISIDFNTTTKSLLGATAFRDPECLYKKIYIGLGADGSPDSTVDSLIIPSGTTSIGPGPLRRNALRTIDDIVALNITAGP